MLVLELCNHVLNLCGEAFLLSTTGNLGSLVRTAINTSIQNVAQSTRASYFRQLVTITATNADFLVAAGTIPDNVLQIFSVQLRDAVVGRLITLEEQLLEHLDGTYTYYSYAVMGDKIYINSRIVRPGELWLDCLVSPLLPLADDADAGLPDIIIPSVAHSAASIVLLSYVDDANAAAVQQRIAEVAITALRNHVGVARGRQLTMGHNNNCWRRLS